MDWHELTQTGPVDGAHAPDAERAGVDCRRRGLRFPHGDRQAGAAMDAALGTRVDVPSGDATASPLEAVPDRQSVVPVGARAPEDRDQKVRAGALNGRFVCLNAAMVSQTPSKDFWAGKRVTVTGGKGFLGRHVVRLLEGLGAKVATFSSAEYNLTKQADVARMYTDQSPEIVIHLAARVGGIGANRDNPGSFFYENAIMGIELMEQARHHDVSKFVQVGTVCAYPKFAKIPFSEDDLWSGYPEETNAPYGLAKKMLLVQAQAYREQYGFNGIYLLPVNLYGPGDNIDLQNSHVIPALIRKIFAAKQRNDDAGEAGGDGS